MRYAPGKESMLNYYGTTDPSLGRGVLDGTAYDDETGMEYYVWRDADGWTLGACHDAVGLMRYWSSDSREELLVMANVQDHYDQATL